MAIASRDMASESQDEIIAEINITPLTDIFLVLLIIFMVTAPALIQQGPKVNLPGSSTKGDQLAGLTITLTNDKKIFVGKQEVTKEKLGELLQLELPKTKEKEVVLSADKNLVIGEMISVMDIARRHGAAKLAIATRPENAQAN